MEINAIKLFYFNNNDFLTRIGQKTSSTKVLLFTVQYLGATYCAPF